MCCGKGSGVLHDEQDEEDDSLIDGPTTDVFSAGVVLYEMVSVHQGCLCSTVFSIL